MTQPIITVRFANPQYNPSTKKYKVDVEFQTDTPGQRLFGMNVRFLYDATKLLPGTNTNGKVNLVDFSPGYGIQNKASCQTATGGIALFGLPTVPVTYVNWAVQLLQVPMGLPYLPSDPFQWLKLFAIETETPEVVSGPFCPAFIWDCQNLGTGKGYVAGIVVTTVAELGTTPGTTTSQPTQEYAQHLNWVDFPGITARPYGTPRELNCINI
jgi:hypothetical protein